MKRLLVTLSDEAVMIWQAYQVRNKIRNRDDALDGLIREFGGAVPVPIPESVPEPVPEPEPIPMPATKYSVEISQESGLVMARSGTKILATCPASSDSYLVFKKAIDSVPANGTFGIGEGLYNVSAPYKFMLDPGGKNPFWVALPVVDKGNMKVIGAGRDNTIIRLLPNQRSPSRHVIMMLVRATAPTSLGNSDFEISGITFDGNRIQQNDKDPYDGESLLLFGSTRSGTKVHYLKFINSWASGAYLGNNGSGPGDNEQVWNIFCQNCGAEGVILDTCSNSRLADSEAWDCREGFCLHGNTDWKSRNPDRISAFNLRTDSQVTVRQVNDFTLDKIEMDCTGSPTSRGLVVRDGNGVVKNSILKTDKTKIDARSGPGATYISKAARVLLEECALEGYFGVHAVGQSRVEAKNCQITAPGGCYCTTDPNPVQSTIVAGGCTWAGKKSDIQEGSSLMEA